MRRCQRPPFGLCKVGISLSDHIGITLACRFDDEVQIGVEKAESSVFTGCQNGVGEGSGEVKAVDAMSAVGNEKIERE